MEFLLSFTKLGKSKEHHVNLLITYLLVERFCLHCPVRRNDMVRSFSVAIACMYRIVTSFFGVASLNTYILEPYSAAVAAKELKQYLVSIP